jgi:hypothetical protein
MAPSSAWEVILRFAGGVSCGIDGALHVVAKLQGVAAVRAVADYLEYTWQPEKIVSLEQDGG